MDLLVIVSDDIHVAALAKARALGSAAGSGKQPGLNAPLPDDARHWLDKIWDATEAALLRARRQGKEAAAAMVQQVDTLLKEASAALAERYNALREALVRRLNEYLSAVIDAALLLVRPTLKVGGRLLQVTTVTVHQRIMLSGSVKASLEEIIEVVAEGELTLSAQYDGTPV